ncbi:DUF2971 domain-containing protein [Cyclobacterium qasimii]|uniref:DUF2971 domain-containing protein n=2 Tax=Cyclobacterium qasimii TaxID=1350429 RepID=S7VNM1_9BACT|nr:DUF2971 domain-containing protein [Cyclobacterium qasimii]EPR71805.1 hypothetical protein ADICYQ_0053 [Cyclobacterium qasimii M12-11B]GEO22148.1 hypothetical protein CQA01_26820 [Cyclobacterium qasimii]
MPIKRFTENSPPFHEPEENIDLARYLDITKFLSLLKNKQLFFCRLDKLEDKFEGSMPITSRKNMIDWYKHMRDVENFFTDPPTNETIDQMVTEDLKSKDKIKSLTCINCWNEFKDESYALWKIYSDLNQGIMIKSTFARIIKAFHESDEEIYCSRIKYIDYENDSFPLGNSITPFIHKHKAYSYEEEIRLIHEVTQKGWEHNWEKEKYNNGVMINVNVQELISEIVISPFSPDWFQELIEDILTKYSIDCKLLSSKLK